MPKIVVFEVHFEKDEGGKTSNKELIETALEHIHQEMLNDELEPSYVVVDVDEYCNHLNEMAGNRDILCMGDIYEEEELEEDELENYDWTEDKDNENL